jgi:hypothetical protein
MRAHLSTGPFTSSHGRALVAEVEAVRDYADVVGAVLRLGVAGADHSNEARQPGCHSATPHF